MNPSKFYKFIVLVIMHKRRNKWYGLIMGLNILEVSLL